MGRFTSYISNVVQQSRSRSISMFRSRVMRVLLGIAFVGALLVPAMIPLTLLLAASFVALPVMSAILSPLVPKRLGSIMPSFSGKGKSHNDKPQAVQPGRTRQPSRRQDERRGKNTGDPLTDALVRRLRDNGLRVSTDWKEARQILESLPDKYRLLKRKDARIYGFVFNGTTYVNPSSAKADVPVHEFTHIWAEVLRQKNPDEWRHIVGLMKQETSLWKKVSEAYPHLVSDDEIADEVLATYSGKRGQQRLLDECVPGRKVEDVFSVLLQALERFWKGVAKFFDMHYETKEDIADRVLSDFLSGVNPLDYGEIRNMDIKHDMDMDTKEKKYAEREREAKMPLGMDLSRLELERRLFAVVKDAKGLDLNNAYGCYFVLDKPAAVFHDPKAPANYRLEDGDRLVGVFFDRERTAPGDYILYKSKDGTTEVRSMAFVDKAVLLELIRGLSEQKAADRLLPIVACEVTVGKEKRITLATPADKRNDQHMHELTSEEDVPAAVLLVDSVTRRAYGWKVNGPDSENVGEKSAVTDYQAVIDRLLSNTPEMRAQVFGRMVSDCKYAISYGDIRSMWMPDDVKGQVAVMKALHRSLPEGTLDLSLDDIALLEKKLQASAAFRDVRDAVPEDGDRLAFRKPLERPLELMFYGSEGGLESGRFSAIENRDGHVFLTGDREIAFDRLIAHDKRILTDVVRKIFVDSQVSAGIVRESMERQIEKFEAATGYTLAVKNDHPYYGEDLMISGVRLESLPENLEVNGDLTLENTVIEGGLPKGLVVYGNLDVKGGNRLSLPDDAFVEGSFRMSEGVPKAYSIVDLSKYDMLPIWVLVSNYAVCKLTKGGADADRPVAVMKIDGQPVAREISQKDFYAYFRTMPDGRGSELTADDIINKYFPSERKAQLARDLEVLRGACPKDGDYFDLPEMVVLESIGRVDPKLDRNTNAVYFYEGYMMVGYDGNAVKFDQLSIGDQRRIVSIVDNALHSPDIAIDERPNNSVEGASYFVTMYQGEKAKALCDEILNGRKNERYPLHFGAKGFFQDGGKYVAFDNSSKDCWVEEFYTRESAVGWCSGAMETEEAQNRQEETDAMREYFLKDAVKAAADRISDPAAKALTQEQRSTVQRYVSLFTGEEQKLWAAGHVFHTSCQEPGMGRIPSAWKADVREELKDLAMGKVRESENVGLKR